MLGVGREVIVNGGRRWRAMPSKQSRSGDGRDVSDRPLVVLGDEGRLAWQAVGSEIYSSIEGRVDGLLRCRSRRDDGRDELQVGVGGRWWLAGGLGLDGGWWMSRSMAGRDSTRTGDGDWGRAVCGWAAVVGFSREHLASQGFCLCVDSRCTSRSTPFPEILGLQFLPCPSYFFTCPRVAVAWLLGAERHRQSPRPRRTKCKDKKLASKSTPKCLLHRVPWNNALLLIAATMGALSPPVPSWGHKSRRDGYAYTPWGKLDILPGMYILCRQSRHVTANQSFPTRKLPDTQPDPNDNNLGNDSDNLWTCQKRAVLYPPVRQSELGEGVVLAMSSALGAVHHQPLHRVKSPRGITTFKRQPKRPSDNPTRHRHMVLCPSLAGQSGRRSPRESPAE